MRGSSGWVRQATSPRGALARSPALFLGSSALKLIVKLSGCPCSPLLLQTTLGALVSHSALALERPWPRVLRPLCNLGILGPDLPPRLLALGASTRPMELEVAPTPRPWQFPVSDRGIWDTVVADCSLAQVAHLSGLAVGLNWVKAKLNTKALCAN